MKRRDLAIERELARLDGWQSSSLAPFERGHLHYQLPEDTTRLIVEVSASSSVEVFLYHGLSALRAERIESGKRMVGESKPLPYVRHIVLGGDLLIAHTERGRHGGYWLVSIENKTSWTSELQVRAHAERKEPS